jgi:hypothetical protein
MASLFDGLNDIDSFELYYDSDLEGLRDAWEDSSDEGNYPEDSDKEDPFGGPNKDNPKPTWRDLPLSTSTSSPTSSFTSLPLYHPQPIRLVIIGSLSSFTIQ